MLTQELSSFLPRSLDHFWESGDGEFSEAQGQMYLPPGGSSVTASGAGNTLENLLGYLLLPHLPPQATCALLYSLGQKEE